MVDLGKNNIFVLAENASGSFRSVLDFYELNFVNMIYLKRVLSYSGISITEIRNISFNDDEELIEKIRDNLFRVNLILIDCNSDYENVIEKVREVTDLPIIFTVMKNKYYADNDIFDTAYKFGMESTFSMDNDYDSKYYVVDLKTEVKQTIKSLKLQAVRDFKLDRLLNGK